MSYERVTTRNHSPEVPEHLLPGSALASLAKYRLNELVRPGDELFEQIAYRLLAKENAGS